MMVTKTCSYCGSITESATKDHVFPANLYPESLQNSKIQRLTVYACTDCNSGWSDDEAHFRNVLMLCGEPDEMRSELFNGPVMLSFDKVDGLRRIDDLLAQVREIEDESSKVKMIFPGEDERVLRVVRKSVRGLCHHHHLLSAVPDDQVWAEIVPFRIPLATLSKMRYDHRDPDVVQYWYFVFNEPVIHSAWIIQFFRKVSFIGRVRSWPWD